MKKILTIFILSVLIFFIEQDILNAQDHIKLQGRVLDIETLSPLPYTSIIIDGTSIGVASNSEGNFKLNIPQQYSDSLIIVSYIGYKPKYLAAGTDISGNKEIYLEPLKIVLGDVVVKAKKVTAGKIVDKAIYSIPDNYVNKTNMLKCFYREITYINNEEVSTTEAMLDVYKAGYQEGFGNDQVKVSRVRQVGGSHASAFDFEGGAYYRISDDVIAHRPGFLLRENLKYYEFTTDRVMGSGDASIIVISFKPDRGAINNAETAALGRHWDTYSSNILSYTGELYIREKDHAIIKVAYRLEENKLRYAQDQFLTSVPEGSSISLKDAAFTAEYRKQKGGYFLNFTSGQIEFRISGSNHGLSQNYKVYNELLTVDKSEHNIRQFDKSEISGTKDLVPLYQDRYDADFWKNENIVEAYSGLLSLGNTDISKVLFEDRIRKSLNKVRTSSPSECIFLHADRNRYISGDNIFFKAYVTEEATGIPSFLSKTFYVLLADSTGKILNKARFRLEAGMGHGNLHIPSDIKQGTYKLISFPSFAQNFEPDNCFIQSIRVEDRISFIEKAETESIDTTGLIPGIDELDIQFMPEGGHLIPGRLNSIAFCAVTKRGSPVRVTMQLKDINHNILDTIYTNDAGLGKFRMLPQKGKAYYATIIKPAGKRNHRFELPEVSEEGIGMELFMKENDNLHLRLFSTSDLPEQLRIVLVKGTEILSTVEKEIRGSGKIKLPFKNRSSGIATLTIYKRGEPVAERLVFLDSKKRLNIHSELEYGAYPERGKMQIRIRVTDRSGNPVQAYLSASVIDSTNCISDKYCMPDIRYSLWLRSNLKKNTPVQIPLIVLNSMRLSGSDLIKDIDLLLLSYGWRKYTAGKLVGLDDNIPDKELINYDMVNGQILPLSKRRKKIPVTELIVYEPRTLYAETVYTDKEGSFSFRPESHLYYRKLLWNFNNKRYGKRWEIQIDSALNRNFLSRVTVVDPADLVMKKNINKTGIPQKFDPSIIMRHIQIPEVTVTGQTPDRSEDRKRLAGLYTNIGSVKSAGSEDIEDLPDLESIINSIRRPTKIVRVDELNSPVLWYYFRSPDIWSFSGVPKALFVVDDAPVSHDMYDIKYITPKMIDKVSILAGPQAFTYFGADALGGAVMIYTKDPGEYSEEIPADPGIVITKPICKRAKVFYKPEYDEPDIDLDKADYRLTINWEPNIITDKNGEAVLEYFNAGYNSYVVGIIQGMDQNGEPVSHRLRYMVVGEQ